jgi:hypothetical protein
VVLKVIKIYILFIQITQVFVVICDIQNIFCFWRRSVLLEKLVIERMANYSLFISRKLFFLKRLVVLDAWLIQQFLNFHIRNINTNSLFNNHALHFEFVILQLLAVLFHYLIELIHRQVINDVIIVFQNVQLVFSNWFLDFFDIFVVVFILFFDCLLSQN